MTAMGDPAFRCAGASVLRDEPIAGTASTVRAFLLLEHPGPWGQHALHDARLPDGLGERIATAAVETRVRVLLVRRAGRRASRAGTDAGGTGVTVLAAYADPQAPWLERGTLSDLHDVPDLDLAALAAGRTVGLDRTDEPAYCVCTHGRHDTCCAERGRPVAAALTEARPEHTWEVSHIGGDRFAGNMLVLPHGLYYGRLDPRSAVAVAGSHDAGHLDLDHLRGRSGLPMPVQRAEIALRTELAETRDDAVRFLARRVVDRGVVEARFAVGGSEWVVRVRTQLGTEPQTLTCRARRDHPIPDHEVLAIERADALEAPSPYS